jgi:3-dehydroquinate dehydratase-2
MKIAVIHGPNLNLLGKRQPEIYGTETLGDLEGRITNWAKKQMVDVTFVQSNSEGALVSSIQEAATTHDAIILNAGGYTHTSVAIADAIASVEVPTVEVHLSDIRKREKWRSVSLVAPVTVRQIYGRGAVGYRDAIRHLVNRAQSPYETVSYGPDPENIADLRRGNADSGLVVLVHGGLWLGQWERDSMESLSVRLHEVGFSTLNIEYRRLGRRPVWPASGHDVELAVRYARTLNADLSVIGHSAGGYLGMWCHHRDPDFRFVGLAPLTDIVSAGAHHPSLKEVVAAGAPGRLAPPRPNATLMHGSDDTLVDPDQSKRFREACRVELLPGVGHFELLDPTQPHWGGLVAALR